MATSTSHLFNNFLGFLASASTNPIIAPIASAVMAASKGLVQTVETEAPTLVTHELDVIAAHNKNSPYIGVAADMAGLLFSAWATTPASTAPAAPALQPD